MAGNHNKNVETNYEKLTLKSGEQACYFPQETPYQI